MNEATQRPVSTSSNGAPLLSLRDVSVGIARRGSDVHPVHRVSFDIQRGETVGLVGESGCGKSLTALSILRLIPQPPARIVAGEILFEGRDLVKLDEADLRAIRGDAIAMIFQEPMTSLNPVYTCGEQIAEVLRLHRGMSRPDAKERSIELLDQVRIDQPSERADAYPHQLSGGMRQRVMIAMAIACGPKLLIADEPTTALDVTIQREILDLVDSLQSELGMSVLHITHDLALVSETAHRILVMYAGEVVESASARELFEQPGHPYTLGLLASRPSLSQRRNRLPMIGGQVPEPGEWPSGCRFSDRCPFVQDRCRKEEPQLTSIEDGHQVRCFELEAVQQAGEWPA